jgi:hypothetical protein
MRRFARHNRKDRTVFGGPSLTSGYSRPPLARDELRGELPNKFSPNQIELKGSSFIGYNEKFRKGGYLCSKAVTAGN